MNNVARNSIWNLVGSGLPLLIGIAIIPALLTMMGLERFGLLTLVWATIGYFSLFDLGIGRATTKYVSEYWSLGDIRNTVLVAKTALFLLAVLGLILSIIVYLFAPFMSELLVLSEGFNKKELINTLYIVAITLPVVLMTSGIRGVLEGKQKFKIINLIKIPASLSMFVIPFVFLFFTNRLDVITFGLFLSRVSFMLIYLVAARDSIFVSVVKNGDANIVLKKLLHYGGWIFLAVAFGTLMSMGYIDRVLIGHMLNVSEISYYATPLEIILRLLIVPAAIMAALFPFLSAKTHADSSTISRHAINIIGLLLLPLVIVSISIGSEILSIWISDEFSNKAIVVLQFMMIGLLFNAVAHIPYTILQAKDQAGITAIRHIIELPVYIPIVIICINYWGVNGAAFSWMIWAITDMFFLFWLVRWKTGENLLPENKMIILLLSLIILLILAVIISALSDIVLRIFGTVVLLIPVTIIAWKYYQRLVKSGKLPPLNLV